MQLGHWWPNGEMDGMIRKFRGYHQADQLQTVSSRGLIYVSFKSFMSLYHFDNGEMKSSPGGSTIIYRAVKSQNIESLLKSKIVLITRLTSHSLCLAKALCVSEAKMLLTPCTLLCWYSSSGPTGVLSSHCAQHGPWHLAHIYFTSTAMTIKPYECCFGFTAQDQDNWLFEKKLVGRRPLWCKRAPKNQATLIPVLYPFLVDYSPSLCVNTTVSSCCCLTL